MAEAEQYILTKAELKRLEEFNAERANLEALMSHVIRQGQAYHKRLFAFEDALRERHGLPEKKRFAVNKRTGVLRLLDDEG